MDVALGLKARTGRAVLVAECHLALTKLPDKSALEAAAELLDQHPADLAARPAALGKSAGAPWGKKEAAAAALAALHASPAQENP
jgi:hypothetical protein